MAAFEPLWHGVVVIVAVWAIGCQSRIPEAVYVCTDDSDCPAAWHCRGRIESERRCYKAAESAISTETLDAAAQVDAAARVTEPVTSNVAPRGGMAAPPRSPAPARDAGAAAPSDAGASSNERGPDNPCNQANGGCEQRCVAQSSSELHCECEPGGILKPDGKTCWNWSASMTLGAIGEGDRVVEPRIAFDAADGALVFWGRVGATTQLSSRSKPKAGSWGAPISVPVGSTFSSRAEFTASDDGTAIALWSALEPSDGGSAYACWSSRYAEASGWSAAARVADPCNDFILTAATNTKGDFYFGWYADEEGPMRGLLAAPYSQQRLGPAQLLYTGTDQRGLGRDCVKFALQDDRSALALYIAENERVAEPLPDLTLLSAEAPPGGTWTTPLRLAPIPRPARGGPCKFDTAIDPKGDGVVVWLQANSDATRYAIWSARRAGGRWDAPTALTGMEASAKFTLAMNERGDAVLAYGVGAELFEPAELRVMRYSKASGWATPERPLENQSISGQPLAQISPTGHIVIVFASAATQLAAIQSVESAWSQPAILTNARAGGWALDVGRELGLAVWTEGPTREVRAAQLD